MGSARAQSDEADRADEEQQEQRSDEPPTGDCRRLEKAGPPPDGWGAPRPPAMALPLRLNGALHGCKADYEPSGG